MERKRKLPARAARVESASKKRTSTPPEPRSQPTPPPSIPVEEPLPTQISSHKPLPTVDSPQPEKLSAKEYQSIPESGVLVDSLQRSRAKWISEGIFEKYWTKPPTMKKKKDMAVDLTNNPARDTMTKLGTCTITVEPHIFEASMYTIKDPSSKQPIPPTIQQPMYRPVIQYGPPNGVMPPPPAVQPPVTPSQFAPPQPNYSRPQDTPISNSDTSMPSQMPPAQQPNGSGPPAQASSNTPRPSNSAPSAATNKSTDPVIQMLAERAATDPSLKALMRIVANGDASADELKKFQAHIDELTSLQKSRQAASQPAPAQAQPFPPQAPPPHQSQFAKPAPAALAPQQLAAKPQLHPQYQVPQPQALRSKGPVPSLKPDISGVVFEFTGGNGDRYLFPKFSILEYLPQGQVIASFLIVRKGSSSDSPYYDRDLDYYQPITIRLYAHQGRQLEALQKVVAPPEEVRRYMDDIMDNMTRAEYVLLAMRLPKDSEPVAEKEAAVAGPTQINDNQVLWATTNPTPVPHVQPFKAVPTEAERYQNFIGSVTATPV